MKGLINAEGQLIRFVDGQPQVSEDPAVFPDGFTIDKIREVFKMNGVEVNVEGLSIVDLDVTIEKPKYKYSVAKVAE